MIRKLLRKSLLLLILISALVSVGVSNVYADSLPSGNAIGAGNAGPYKSPGIMAKFMIYDPGNMGITAGNYSKDEESPFVVFDSKSERTVFEMATKDYMLVGNENTKDRNIRYLIANGQWK